MEADLNKDSWHQRLITWSEGEVYQPSSLCPYWWTLVWCLVSAIPRYILRKIWAVLSYVGSKIWASFAYMFEVTGAPSAIEASFRKWDAKPQSATSKWFDHSSKNISKGIVGTLLGFIAFLLVMSIIEHGWGPFLKFLLILIGSALALAVILGVAMFFFWIGETDAWRMIKGMYYSVKEKVCPAINWN